MASKVSAKDLFAFVSENSEMFAKCSTPEEMTEVLETLAQNETLVRKFTENVSADMSQVFSHFRDAAHVVAETMSYHIKPLATSGNRRIGIETEFGTLTLILGFENASDKE